MSGELSSVLPRENRTLFSLVCRFNSQPARYIHPDRVTELAGPELLSRLRVSNRGARRLSEWITTRFELDSAGFWDFRDERRRLALLDGDTLQALISLAGAAVSHQQIAKVIDRDGQRRLKESLGERLYLFAVKRAQFLLRNIPEELSEPLRDDPAGQLREIGGRCLSVCLADQPDELVKRFELKFPPGFTLGSQTHLAESEIQAVSKTLRRILISEIDADWSPCFN